MADMSTKETAIFENVGVVQEGMQTIAVPHSGVGRPGARPLEVSRGEIRSEGASPAEPDIAEPARIDLVAGDEKVDPAPHLDDLLNDPVFVRRLELHDLLDRRT